MRRLLLALALVLPVHAEEEQAHGVVFEQWVRDTFFGGYKPESYTQVWDIPAEANKDHGGIPANPKAIKFGMPIDLGDAMRQYEHKVNAQPFLLVVGFWDQEGDFKRWVQGVAATVSPAAYARLWHPITQEDLAKLDAIVKDKSLSIEEARAQAKALKSKAPFTQSIMQVNPKLDGKQRRLQCSLRFDDFFECLLPDVKPERQEQPRLWGKPMPAPLKSPPRRAPKR